MQTKQTTHGPCHDCGAEIHTPESTVKTGSGATGYAILHDPEGAKICYACADTRERDAMLTENRFIAYVSRDWSILTTWTGGKLGTVTRVGSVHPFSRHSFDGERHYISATDVHGQKWRGTGAPGMYARLRKCKAVA